MRKDELVKEIKICEDEIHAITTLLVHSYGTKLKDISKLGIIKDYAKRLDTAKKELAKIENKKNRK